MSHTEPLNGSQRKPVRQQQVATGVDQRRTWTRAQKARIVAESYAGGRSLTAVARRHGIPPQQLYRWRSHDRLVDGAQGKDVAFAPVMLEPAREDQSRRNVQAPTIEIEIGAMTVRVPAGCDPTTLQMVLRLVVAAS